MMAKKVKRITSLFLVLALVVVLCPVFLATHAAATGYDNGYSGGMAGDGYIRAYGVDVSEHQGEGFNFQNLKNNGYSFVILRCGFVTRKDYRFEEYYQAARAAGLDIGVYFYSYATNASEASYEADRCLNYIKGKTFEYPIYFDYEDPSANSRNSNTAYSICRTFLDKIAAAGYLAGLYGYASWMDPNYGAWVPTASICGGKYECWMANYYNGSPTNPKSANYPSTYGMYQYTSTNKIGGVGPLDTNVCYKDYPTIVKTYGFNGYSVSQPTYATIVNGTYTIGMHDNSSYKVDIRNASKDNGAAAHCWSQTYGASQKFVFESDGADAYTIRNVNSGKYLEILYGGAHGEYKVTQCDYTGADCQRWYLIWQNDGSFSLKNKGTGKYMDLPNGTAANGSDIQTWDGNGSNAQKFWLDPVTTLVSGVYKLGAKNNSNFVLNVAGNSHSNGANVWVWESGNNNSDKWVVQAGSDGYYTLREMDSNKYLDVVDGGRSAGTNVQLYAGNGSDAQKWAAVPNTDGTYTFYSKCSGLALDLDNGLAQNGQNVHTYWGNYGNTQKWILQRQSVLADGTYFIGNASNPSYRMEISGRSKDNGGNLILYRAHGATSQQFKFEKQSDGFYTITNVNSGKQLDAGGKAPGTNVQQWADTGTNQKWSVLPNADGSYSFVSAANNLCMDLSGNNLSNDANIMCWTGNGCSAQSWVLSRTDGQLKDGVYQMASAMNGGFRADICGPSAENGASVHLWQAHGGESQKYQLTNVGNGFYTIQSLSSGKYFDIANGSADNGANLQQYNGNGSDAQKFLILKNLDGTYSLIACHSGKAIDLSSGSLANGANIQQWAYSASSSNQKWTFASATHIHSYTATVVKNTKTQQGYTLHSCACGDSYKDNFVEPDAKAPVVSNVQITELTCGGYRVTCDVSDNVGVTTVKFPTWTEKDGQDDILWHVATVTGGKATFYVKAADHKCEIGLYNTHIYAYDAVGNYGFAKITATVPEDDLAPVVSDIQISDVSADGYRVTCKITDNIGVTSVKFPTWTENNGQDDIIWHEASYADGVATFYVKASDHNTESGKYLTHIYAYDAKGNVKCYQTEATLPTRIAAAPVSGQLISGVYVIGNAANRNFVLDVQNNSDDNCANIHIWKAYAGLQSQIWSITDLGNGYCTIRNLKSGKLLDATNNGQSNGTNVIQHQSNGGDNQLWQIVVNSNGTYTFVNKCNGKALDMSGGGNPCSGQNIQCWEVNNTTAQQWSLMPYQVVENGTYTIRSKADTGFAMDVDYNNIQTAANVQVYSYNGGEQQQFKLEYLGNGLYSIRCVASGRCLNVCGGGTSSGTNVQQYGTGEPNAHEKWSIVVNDDGSYTFIAACNGLALDMNGGGNPYNGQNVQCWEFNNSTAQRWNLQ